MRFAFNEEKAAAAAARLLELNKGPMEYIKLIKLLYLADRRSLIETGYPITGDAMVSMDHGPVLSRVYDSLNFAGDDGPWQRHVSAPENYAVRLLAPTDGMPVSEYEEEVLREVFSAYGHLLWPRLVELMHELPEWQDPHGSSWPIDARIILREAGKSDEEIEQVASQAEAVRSFASSRWQPAESGHQ